MIYGIIDNGVLRTKECEDASQAPEGYKPVEALDYEKAKSSSEEYTILIVPYDAGDKIAYKYDKVYNTYRVRSHIKEKKAELESTDYRVLKCYEASLAQEEMPYDMTALREERQKLRDEINELEATLAEHTT